MTSSSSSTKFELTQTGTGKKSILEARSGTLGPDCLNIGTLTKDLGVFTFDPGFMATAACESRITYIDGDNGVLLYQRLSDRADRDQVELRRDGLPADPRRAADLGAARPVRSLDPLPHDDQRNAAAFLQRLHYDAHPMAMVSAVVSSMAAFYHDSMDNDNPRHREIFAHRIIAKIPTVSGCGVQAHAGQPFIYPRNDMDYCANMLHMFFAVPAEDYVVDPWPAQALDLLLILHATTSRTRAPSTVRLAGSTGTNPYAAISAGVSRCGAPPRRRERGRARDARGDRHGRQHPEVPRRE
jgi:citrate synthase